jgi:uncharacterized DUF497 family protein
MVDFGIRLGRAQHSKCRNHGVSLAEIEEMFTRRLAVKPDVVHSRTEQRFCAVGRGKAGRRIFLVFTLRTREGRTYIRPISARYMHGKEIEHYEKENPDL